MKNVAYQEKSLDDNPELMSEVQERTGFSMVPMILVGEKVVSGANLGLLSELLMV
jgi:glutaredoxin